jgi:putative transcriptional regulator
MMGLEGRLLVAMPSLTDPNFSRTVIQILAHDTSSGTVGVIVNRPSVLDVSEHLPLIADVVVHPQVVFIGGPVQREIAVTVVMDELGRPKMIDGPETSLPCRVFSGYSGWGPGQLSEEIAEGAWHVTDARPDDVFSRHPEHLWADVWKRQDGPLRMLATFPLDLRAN